jgi:hypothetical protein
VSGARREQLGNRQETDRGREYGAGIGEKFFLESLEEIMIFSDQLDAGIDDIVVI